MIVTVWCRSKDVGDPALRDRAFGSEISDSGHEFSYWKVFFDSSSAVRRTAFWPFGDHFLLEDESAFFIFLIRLVCEVLLDQTRFRSAIHQIYP